MKSSLNKKSANKHTGRAAVPDAVSVKTSAQETSVDNILSQGRALFILISATVLVYANSLNGSFVFDDTKQIVNNPALRSWSNILRAFTNDVWSFQRATLNTDIPPPYYRPLFSIYLTLNYQLFGLWEPGWHLANLAVHVTATVLVYYLVRELSADRIVALLAALLFGVHPIHVESVSWISGIPDPLAALFYVPSLLWYVRYREQGERKWLFASVVAYALSILCKETPLVLPLILLGWECVQAPTKDIAANLKQTVLRLAPYAAVAAGYVALRFSVLGLITWQHPFMASVPTSTLLLTVPVVVLIYLKHLLAPFYLSLIYSPPFVAGASDWKFLLSAVLLLGAALLLLIYRKAIGAQVWLGIVLIAVPLLAVLNLRAFHNEYLIQDRYLYLSSIGFCYLLALGIARIGRRRRVHAAWIGAVVVLVFGVGTMLQNRIWNNSIPLWQRAVAHSPNSRSTHYNLGLAYLGQKQYDSALNEMLRAKQLDPDNAAVYNNLAMAQAALGQTDEAVANLETALKLDPRSLEAHNNLGALLFDKKNYEGSKREFSLVLARDSSSASARFNLARTMAALNDHAGAIREFESLLAQNPNDVAARYELGLSYAAVGRKHDAETELRRALSSDRDATRAAQMQEKLAQLNKE
jgi:Tfp pilus assembly protein PilF